MFKNAGIDIPNSVGFADKDTLIKNIKLPCVVKFETHETIGTQTLVLTEPSDYKILYENVPENPKGIVQDYIDGDECTVSVIVGDHNWVMLGSAQDYKQVSDGDLGLNTFGLGSINIQYFYADEIIEKIVNTLRESCNYRGFLSCQFIIGGGKLWLMECNTRLCDPEFQSMAESLSVDVYQSMVQCFTGQNIVEPCTHKLNAVTVSLIHRDWPNVCEPKEIDFPENDFRIYRNPGTWDRGTYYGSITNSGKQSHYVLAQQIYKFLRTVDIGPYRYRTDIGKKKADENNLENDLLTTEWILEKVRNSSVYAQHLYAAMCNNEFQKREVLPILTGQTWACSWRYAGGLIADMREEGDYMDWYCSGIRDTSNLDQFVGESVVTEEIEQDLLTLGWNVVDSGETDS